MVDPAHATGKRSLVHYMTKAVLVVGALGIQCEITKVVV